MADLSGKVIIDRYHVDEFIGKGGMADVYKVWDNQRAAYLAMKVLHADLAEDKVFLRRFKREAQTLAKLQHPNIVRFYGLEQTDDFSFILMDYIEGTTLRKEIYRAQDAFSFERALEIMKPVCSALHYAHAQGIAHCDIKPANIMIHKNGSVLLSDFGIARMTEAATVTMVGAGTPAYMAPEQARGEDPTPQTDIYALGIILYEMLTGGERPFTGENARVTGSTSEKIRWEQINTPPPAPRSLNPSIPSAVEAVILKCLQKDPAQRYSGALDLLNTLSGSIQPVAASPKVPSVTPMEPAPAPLPPVARLETAPLNPVALIASSPRPRKLVPWVVGVILLALVLFFAAFSHPLRAVLAPTITQVPTFTYTPTLAPTSTYTATIEPTATFVPVTPTLTPTVTITSDPMAFTDEKGVEMRLVPAGEFNMGSSADDALNECLNFWRDCRRFWFTNEEPVHKVVLDAFFMDKFEVTNALYKACVDAGVCAPPKQSDSYSRQSYFGNSQYEDHPVLYVDRNMAKSYCEWRGARLPSEAEWEKAARGELEGKKYPWGNQTPDCTKANFDECIGDTTRVGSYAPNGYGLYDMAGNVFEWVNDWYDANYYKYSPVENPPGPAILNAPVLRGGSWGVRGYGLRVSYRLVGHDDYSGYGGFRCARSSESP